MLIKKKSLQAEVNKCAYYKKLCFLLEREQTLGVSVGDNSFSLKLISEILLETGKLFTRVKCKII